MRKAAPAPDTLKLKPRKRVTVDRIKLAPGVNMMSWGNDIRPTGLRKANWAYRTRKGNAKPSDCRTA